MVLSRYSLNAFNADLNICKAEDEIGLLTVNNVQRKVESHRACCSRKKASHHVLLAMFLCPPFTYQWNSDVDPP